MRIHAGSTVQAQDRTWVADFTHVAAWASIIYTAFVVDTISRRIVGGPASPPKKTQLVLEAMDM
ncbi:hypothetical protein [Streptomyces globisporus]|uniref:hypothetical protein n=1 Tax=Streptomyces globisporus TaxID=1908 RepID=UPI0036C5615F